jgi:hypothetical protein
VGAVCILTRALRLDGFFFVLLPDGLDFTVVTVLCVCEALVELVGAVDFEAVELLDVDFAVVDCAATHNGIKQIHNPPARKNPPAARRMIVFALFLNAPR